MLQNETLEETTTVDSNATLSLELAEIGERGVHEGVISVVALKVRGVLTQ